MPRKQSYIRYSLKLKPLPMQKLHTLTECAREKMTSQLSGELERLKALKAVNPNIRDEELSHLSEQMGELNRYLDSSKLQLDAIRLVLVSHA